MCLLSEKGRAVEEQRTRASEWEKECRSVSLTVCKLVVSASKYSEAQAMKEKADRWRRSASGGRRRCCHLLQKLSAMIIFLFTRSLLGVSLFWSLPKRK